MTGEGVLFLSVCINLKMAFAVIRVYLWLISLSAEILRANHALRMTAEGVLFLSVCINLKNALPQLSVSICG